jgi:cellulose synthase/poly-beta-1,6-N-acetylglucosamine synthase-like glycosyltransferase
MGPFGFEPPTPPQDSIIQNECFEGAVSHIPKSGCLPLCVAHLSQYGVPLDVIEQGIAKASQLGMTIPDVLIAEGFVSEITFYRSLAQSLGLEFGFIHQDIFIHEDCSTVISSGIVEIARRNGETYFAAAPRGDAINVLISAFSEPRPSTATRVIVTVPSHFVARVRHATREQTLKLTTDRLQQCHPAWSAANLKTRTFVTVFLGALITTIIGGALYPSLWHLSMLALTAYPVLPALALKSYILARGFGRASISKPKLLSDKDLPVYTILVPLYDEATVIPQLIQAILALDYPRSKLDVKILLEESDDVTIAAVRKVAIHRIFDIIICPAGKPKTKPRALDFGLYFARGEYVVVYDAEDVPEPGQLKLAAAYFAASDKKLGCLQGRLAIDNATDYWLSRIFSLEYARLFDVTIPEMAAAGFPIPLGGTSNHFRKETLEAIFGWDPWNVTEDADLGLRLARLGYSVADLPSSTFEEAPNTLNSWFSQRTRWMKGWMQTALVHCRNPLNLVAEVGFRKALLVLLISTNAVVSSLLHPLLLIVIGVCVGAYEMFHSSVSLSLWVMGAILLLSGVICLALLIEGSRRRSISLKWSDFPLFFIHSVLVMAATWWALIELAKAPSLWRKTAHGLTKASRTRPDSSPQK